VHFDYLIGHNNVTLFSYR